MALRNPGSLRWGWPTVACVAAFGGGALVGVCTPAGGVVVPPRLEATVAPRVHGELPAWLAPGAKLTVDGWAGPGAPVSLVVGGRRVAAGTSGKLGRFTLTGPVGRAGRLEVEVASGDRRVRAGTLLVRPLLLAAAGDVTPGEGVSEAVANHGDAYPWWSVARLLRGADIATANLEGVISNRGVAAAGKEYHFRGGHGLLRGAAETAGLDVLTVANNHSLDYGRDAFLDTIAAAHAAGIRTVGGGASSDAARRPVILTAGGLRVALLGYSDVRPAGFDAGPGLPGTARADPAEIAADVAAARRRADLVVVWFHWGVELEQQPNERQRELGAAALAAGATVVLGAHPHVLQPVMREGRRLVAWSLGNFVFPAGSPQTTHSGILVASLDAHGVTGYRLARATIHGFRPELDAPPLRTIASNG